MLSRILLQAGFLFCALTGLTSVAHSQTATPGGGAVTITDLVFSERTKRGIVTGCELEYRLWFPDHFQNKGNVVALIGAVGVLFDPDSGRQPALILKVRGRDFRNNQFVPFDVTYAYLRGGGQSLAGREVGAFKCEGDGACVSYTLLNEPAMLNSLTAHGFAISYLRANASADVTIPVPYDSPEKALAFANCTGKVLKSVEAALKKNSK